MKKFNKDYKKPMQEILAASSLAYLLSPFRSIWSLFLFIFLLLSIYYVTLNILDYLKYDTTTSIYTINEQVIFGHMVDFFLFSKILFFYYYHIIKCVQQLF